MKHRHTIEELQSAAKDSLSIREMLMKLGIASQGGNYKTLYKRIEANGIDISHFTGQGHNKGKTYIKTHITDYLSNNIEISSFRLKNRLLKEGLLDRKCSCCGLSEWLGNPIPIELDHIDGNHANNNLTNLRLLCPNCHAMTDTYRGKNQKRVKDKGGAPSGN